jgi:hypothetical protein
MALTVPIPIVSQDAVTGGKLLGEKPINIACGPVLFPDGVMLKPENAAQFGYRFYREQSGGISEVWNEGAGTWQSATVESALQPMFPKDDKWCSIFAAIAPPGKVTSATGGFPRYSVQCHFRGRDEAKVEHTGSSPRSAPVEILLPGEKNRAGMAIVPEVPVFASRIRMFLKDVGLTERGVIEIREESGGFIIELAASGAIARLEPSGDILLRPRPGGQVAIDGPLSVSAQISVGGINLMVP